MRFGAIVAARFGSRRLPGKALLPLLGLPVLQLVIRRLKTSRRLEGIVLATTTRPEDDALAAIAAVESVGCVRGPEDDVLARYAQAARISGFEHVVRVTADCPMVAGATLDPVLEASEALGSFDLVTTKPAYPHGIDYEVFPAELLKKLDGDASLSRDEREHIMNHVYQNCPPYRVHRLPRPGGLARIARAFLLDTPSDYESLGRLLSGVTDVHVDAASLEEET